MRDRENVGPESVGLENEGPNVRAFRPSFPALY